MEPQFGHQGSSRLYFVPGMFNVIQSTAAGVTTIKRHAEATLIDEAGS